MVNKYSIVAAALTLFGLCFQAGKYIESISCKSKLESQIDTIQKDFENQIEKENNKIETKVIKIKKQNEIIKTSINNITISSRFELLAKIKNFEAASKS